MKRKLLLILAILFVILATIPVALNPEREDLTPRAREAAPGDFVQLSAGMVHYELAGPLDGQPVVLIHGFSAPYYIWDGAFEVLAEAGFRVLRYDLYGRGYSDRPFVTYDKTFYATQFLELLAALDLQQPVDVVGGSFGAIIAAAITADHPDAVRKLVLVAPAVLPDGSEPFLIPVVGEYLTYAALLPMLPRTQSSDFVDPSRIPPDWAQRYRDQLRFRGTGHALLSSVRHTAAGGALPDFRRVAEQDRDVLLIWGEQDQTADFSWNTQAREALVDAEFLPVPNAGHLAHIERPDVVHPALIAFLNK